MYRGFNLKLDWQSKYDEQFFETGNKLFETNKNTVKERLENFGGLSNVEPDWTRPNHRFPQTDARTGSP